MAGLGIVALLTVTGQAKTYVDKVPDFHLLPSGGPGSVDYTAHVHDEDCCEGETLVRYAGVDFRAVKMRNTGRGTVLLDLEEVWR